MDTHLFPDSKMGSRFLLTAMASSKKASSRSGATPSAVKSRSTRCAEPSKAPKRARCKGGEGYQRECTMSGGSPRYGSHAERRVGRDSEWERDNASRWEECEIREAWLELDKVPPPISSARVHARTYMWLYLYGGLAYHVTRKHV